MIELTKLANGGSICEADPGEVGYPDTPRRGSISERECAILAELARNKMVLEIGTGLGVSTRALASTAYRVDTIDIDPWVIENIHPNVAPARAFTSRADLVAKYDLAFIDGNHYPTSVVEDVQFAMSVMQDGGLIVLHDSRLKMVKDGWRCLGSIPMFEIATEFGLGLIVYGGNR